LHAVPSGTESPRAVRAETCARAARSLAVATVADCRGGSRYVAVVVVAVADGADRELFEHDEIRNNERVTRSHGALVRGSAAKRRPCRPPLTASKPPSSHQPSSHQDDGRARGRLSLVVNVDVLRGDRSVLAVTIPAARVDARPATRRSRRTGRRRWAIPNESSLPSICAACGWHRAA
jgi:hypothetical protein